MHHSTSMTGPASSQLQRCETQLRDFLAVLLRGVPLEVLSKSAPGGKWSALTNLAHLARYHEIFLDRLERILAERAPAFPRYRAEDDPQWPAWEQLPPQEVMERLSSLRTRLSTRLHSLSKADFQCTGIHPKFGEMDLALWLEFFLVHEAHHLYRVLQLVRTSAG